MGTGARARTAGAVREVPQRSADFSHLTLDGLRTYRRAVSAEEGRVSYWRRLIQARLDVVSDVDQVTDPTSHERFRTVFAESRSASRQALVNVVVKRKRPLSELPGVARAIGAVEKALGRDGRVLVRFSGTENKARVLVEGPDARRIQAWAGEIAEAIESELG